MKKDDPLSADTSESMRRPIDFRSDGPGTHNVSPLRDTGIEHVGRIPWGTHVCVFFEKPGDLIEAIIPYFKAGIEQDEYCIWPISRPITRVMAKHALQESFSDDQRQAIELVQSTAWYLRDGRIDSQRIIELWKNRIEIALAQGFSGVRVGAITLWHELTIWRDFQEYERDLEKMLRGRRMIVLCFYQIGSSFAEDIVEAACSHQCLIVRQDHQWRFLEALGSSAAVEELNRLNRDVEPIRRRAQLQAKLTDREQVILGQIIKGKSSKQIAYALGISPRTVEVYRSSIMKKLGARNTADLVRRVLEAD